MSSLFGVKTRPLAGASTFASMETQLFNVLYFLQKETSYHTLYFVATAIQFCHLLNNAFLESTFAWNHDVIYKSGFGMALEYITLELFLVDVAAFYVMFSIAAGVVLLLVGLTVFMSKALSSGNVPPQKLSRFVQFLVSAMIAFEGPLSRILMAQVECDYGHTGVNPYWGWTCFDSPIRVVLYILSIVLVLVFVVLIGIFSFMHASSPKSQDASTRTVSWIDTINSMFQISTVVFFRLAWRAPFILSVFFFIGGAFLTVLVCKFQPFYRSSMNSFRVAIHAVTAWTGFCLMLITLINDHHSAIVSTVYLTAFPMVAWQGWRYSKSMLEARTAEGQAAALTDDQLIAHDMIIERMRQRGSEVASETWKEVLGASFVEQRTRFLQTSFTANDIAKADAVFRAGLKSFPLSEYLLMQYVTFLVVYKSDFVLANLIINQCLRTRFTDIESRLNIYRLHKDLQRTRQLGDSAHRSNREVDVISFEEAQKTLRSARASHRHAHDQMRALLADISKGAATAANVARRAEKIFNSEEHAAECFEVLMSQSEDSAEIYISYGNFLKDVMLDGPAADAMFQMASNCRSGGNQRDANSENAGSSVTAVSSKFSRMARLKDIEKLRDAKLKKLSWKMRAVTVLLLSIVLGVFFIFFFMNQQFMESLLNLNDSAMRSTTMLTTPYNVRSMHIAAVDNNTEAFEAAKAAMQTDVSMARTCHNNLVFKYSSTFSRQQEFLNKPNVDQFLPSTGGFVNVSMNGDDTVSKFLQHAQVLLNGSMDEYRAVVANNSLSYISFFYILSNWFNGHLAMDKSTTLYQLEAEQYAFYSWLGIVLSAVVAALVEIAVVIFMFWPAVQQLFEQFGESIMSIQVIGAAEAKMALTAGLTARTADIIEEVDKGDASSDTGSPRVAPPPLVKQKSVERNIENVNTKLYEKDDTSPPVSPALGAPSPSVGLLLPNKLTAAGRRLPTREAPARQRSSSVSSDKSDTLPLPGSRFRVYTSMAEPTAVAVSSEQSDIEAKQNASDGAESDSGIEMVITVPTPYPESGGCDAVSLASDHVKTEAAPSIAVDIDTAAETERNNRSQVIADAKARLASTQSDARDTFRTEALETERRRRIRVLYIASMCLTVSSLLGFCIYGVLSVQKSTVVSVELTSVSRTQDVISCLNVAAREHAYSNYTDYSLIGSGVRVFDEIEKLNDYLNFNSRAALMSHTAFIYGYDEGFKKFPRANGWAPITYDSTFSPYTRSRELFYAGNRCKGGVKSRPSISNILFHDNCLTQLKWRDDGDRASSNPRVQFLATTLDTDTSRCTFDMQRDPLLTGGYHDFFEEIIRGYLRFSTLDPSESSIHHPLYQFLDRYTHQTPEFMLGTRKLMLELQRESLTRIDHTMIAMVLFLVIVGVVVTLQYFVLGRQLSHLLSQNLGMEDVVTRLVAHCALFSTMAADRLQRKALDEYDAAKLVAETNAADETIEI